MNKIFIFYGSNRAFSEKCPKESITLTDVVMEIDNESKNMTLFIQQLENSEEEQKRRNRIIKINNFVINSDEYSGVREHVIIDFANFISNLDIENMYIQNPPLHISDQLHRLFDKKNIIEEVNQDYCKVTEDVMKKFYSEYDSEIIGQEKAKGMILQALYPLVHDCQKKPVTILFYGNTGIGKTETAKYISKLLNGKLLRKQFSMYQNDRFATYLFGGSMGESCFAKDLLDRDSNVILLDEFDKANQVFHSAFYQLFDDGIYEDGNYKVILDFGIIICTSNYKTKKEIIENLGSAIYNRFDAVIYFEELSIASKEQIIKRTLREYKEKYKEKDIVISEEIINRLEENAVNCSNVREIRRLIKNTFSLLAVRKMCIDKQE